MKFPLIIGIVSTITYSPFVYAADNLNKVKLVKATVPIISPEYFDLNYKAEVTRVNQTYNRLDVDFTVIKNLPLNTQLVVEVYRSDLTSNEFKKILDTGGIPVCKKSNNKYAKYLPELVIQLQEAGQCVPKRRFKIDGVQYFKFYDALSDQQLRDARFKTYISLASRAHYFYTLQLESVSNRR